MKVEFLYPVGKVKIVRSARAFKAAEEAFDRPARVKRVQKTKLAASR